MSSSHGFHGKRGRPRKILTEEEQKATAEAKRIAYNSYMSKYHQDNAEKLNERKRQANANKAALIKKLLEDEHSKEIIEQHVKSLSETKI